MYNPFSLIDKTIFVTGASSGIGKAIAIECSKMGATVIITGRNKERLNEAYNLLDAQYNQSHIQVVADVTDDNDVQALISELPQLDGIVHCAGIGDIRPFQFVSKESLNQIFSTNFFFPVLATNEMLKKKIIKKSSSIVFISSIAGTVSSYIAGSSYGATKGAIDGVAKGMALDLAHRGIRVNTIRPGMINTNILHAGHYTDEQLKEDVQNYPLKRYGNPEEVAYACIYLLSDVSKWVTGTNLLIDGGYTLL